jgi:membrane protein YqaA with SNARE-associated domain
MRWSRHRRAPWYLAGLSFAESSFFPIPPDTMLVPMSMANPQRAWHLALLTTIASVLGGILGYLLGFLAFEVIHPWIIQLDYADAYQTATQWFERWGFWAVLLAGFTPIPYKLFTIAAGAMLMPLLPFLAASLVGRGGRFFLIAGLMRWRGAQMEKFFMRHMDRVAWIVIGVLVAYLLYQWLA